MHQKTSLVIVLIGLALVTAMYVSAGGQQETTNTYLDGRSVKVALKELEPAASAAILARNAPLYSVYTSDGCEPEGRGFVYVIDSVRSDGTGSLWRGVQIEFNPGYPCHQFTSVEEITAAVKSGEISLNPTGYIYRCRVLSSQE
ncbi:MAG TPA: hypothetical protein VF247_07915 [Candidatus Krumholzibacteria bacterium]